MLSSLKAVEKHRLAQCVRCAAGIASNLLLGCLTALLAAIPSPTAAQEVVIGRNADGRISIRAVRVNEPIKIDGELLEAVYRDIQPISDFIQQIPDEGGRGVDFDWNIAWDSCVGRFRQRRMGVPSPPIAVIAVPVFS